MHMRIGVDPSVCDGFGYCAELLPEALVLDEWGFPIVVNGEIPPQLLRAARQAVKSCPRRALALRSSEPSRAQVGGLVSRRLA
jgi:ferredoxin